MGVDQRRRRVRPARRRSPPESRRALVRSVDGGTPPDRVDRQHSAGGGRRRDRTGRAGARRRGARREHRARVHVRRAAPDRIQRRAGGDRLSALHGARRGVAHGRGVVVGQRLLRGCRVAHVRGDARREVAHDGAGARGRGRGAGDERRDARHRRDDVVELRQRRPADRRRPCSSGDAPGRDLAGVALQRDGRGGALVEQPGRGARERVPGHRRRPDRARSRCATPRRMEETRRWRRWPIATR